MSGAWVWVEGEVEVAPYTDAGNDIGLFVKGEIALSLDKSEIADLISKLVKSL